jgi:hypothetical protein
MRTPLRLGLLACLWLAFGCGRVVVDRGDGGAGGAASSAGGGGAGGAGAEGGAGGSAADCKTADCKTSGSSCTCETTCAGPKLRAECATKGDSTIVCACHYSGSYMGTCARVGGPLCDLPGGCCGDYLK